MDDRRETKGPSDHLPIYFGDNLQKHLLTAYPSTGLVLAPTMRLIQKRREDTETQKTLDTCRQKFEEKLMAQKVRKEELQQREANIKEGLMRDLFLKDSHLKRSRAVSKAARERLMTAKAAAPLALLTTQLKELTLKKDKLITLVQKHEIFPRYLDQVVRSTEKFQDVWQAMSRMEILLQTKEDLLRSLEQSESLFQGTRAQFRLLQDQTSSRLLLLNNQLARQHKELDQAYLHTSVWERRWAHIQNTAAKNTLLLGTIKVAILNLYQMTMKQTKVEEKPVGLEGTFSQLDKVQIYLRNLSAVWEELSKH